MMWESYKEPTPPCVVILLPPTWQEVICLGHIYSLSMVRAEGVNIFVFCASSCFLFCFFLHQPFFYLLIFACLTFSLAVSIYLSRNMKGIKNHYWPSFLSFILNFYLNNMVLKWALSRSDDKLQRSKKEMHFFLIALLSFTALFLKRSRLNMLNDCLIFLLINSKKLFFYALNFY